MTFQELCQNFNATPTERLKLWRMLAFIRLEKMLDDLPPTS